jgi:hypothetical protein
MRTPSTLFVPLLLLAGACASQSAMPPAANPSPAMASAMSTMPPRPDPRVGLKPGLTGAGEAIWNLRLLSNVPSPPGFAGVTNSDLAFLGSYALQGNYNGFQVWDISRPTAPTLVKGYLCPASQSDVSVYRNLLFVSAEAPSARLDCGTEGVRDTVSHHRIRGIRIFDITDITDPKYIGNVQTCRGSHTHSVLVDPQDPENVYIYISGSAGVRSPNELPGCSRLYPEEDPSSALFRIEVIKVPLAHPEQAAVVSSPRIFQDLAPAPRHGEAPEDIAAQQAALDSARRVGGFIAMRRGREVVLGSGFVTPLLDSIVKVRGGTGSPTGADSAALRGSLDQIVAATFGQPEIRPPSGPNQCHDITLYPEVGLAGGACGGYGLLLDIRDPANPIRLDAVADSNFAYWHSATFNNDATKILFTDEWGGGGAPKCRATDKYEWGGDAIFTLTGRKMGFQSYYKMAAPQTPLENCVAHNGSLIPIPGRDIMVQGWYQGGISIFDWTDPGHPKEIAFHDRGPVDSTRMQMGGSWSVYWYNGVLVSSEIARGLDIFELVPSAFISQNEIDAAETVRLEYLNAQGQPKFVWPPSFALARAYLDQLERSSGLATENIAAARTALAGAERANGDRRRTALSELATRLSADAAGAADAAKVRTLVGAVTDLANVQR